MSLEPNKVELEVELGNHSTPDVQPATSSQEIAWPRFKLFAGGLGMAACLIAANVLGQTNAPSELAAKLPDEPNVLYAMIGQVLNNPSSLLVIAFLCIVCWLLDDLPFVNSKYVVHCSVVAGGSIYWMFTAAETVPRSFPHPLAVFIVNGCICGFIAFVIHQQAVSRFINYFGANKTQKK